MKLEKILKITLGIQLVFLIFINYPRNNQASNEKQLLSNLAKNNLSKIIISEDKKTVTLEKQGSIWTVADKFHFPANPEKISAILDSCFTPQKIGLVGKTKNALIKFKLNDDNYIEKVTLHEDGKEDDVILLGETPEFKKVYARNIKNENSYLLDAPKYDFESDAISWYIKNLFGANKETVKKIIFPNFSVIKKEGKLTLENIPEGKDINTSSLEFLCNKIFNISIEDVISENKEGLNNADFIITIEKEDGSKIDVKFKKEDDQYILNSTNLPWNMKITKNTYNDLKENKLDDFLTAKIIKEENIAIKKEEDKK